MDSVPDDHFMVYIRSNPSDCDRPDSSERPLLSCSTYEEARRVQRHVLTLSQECVIRFLGSTGGGD